MDIRSFLLGSAEEFKSPPDIFRVIAGSPQFDPSMESVTTAEPLLIFQTSKQQTWLVATPKRLYCVLDDLGRSFTRVQWSIPRERLVTENKVSVSIASRERREKSERSGLLDIDNHRSWLYSKKLFASESRESQVKRLIARRMLG
jgi:hypothetical protein